MKLVRLASEVLSWKLEDTQVVLHDLFEVGEIIVDSFFEYHLHHINTIPSVRLSQITFLLF